MRGDGLHDVPTYRHQQRDGRRTRGLALAEIIAARENASSLADRCFQSYLYGAHPYGHPPARA